MIIFSMSERLSVGIGTLACGVALFDFSLVVEYSSAWLKSVAPDDVVVAAAAVALAAYISSSSPSSQ